MLSTDILPMQASGDGVRGMHSDLSVADSSVCVLVALSVAFVCLVLLC